MYRYPSIQVGTYNDEKLFLIAKLLIPISSEFVWNNFFYIFQILQRCDLFYESNRDAN